MPSPAPEPLSEDEKTLHRLGYKQELARRMSGFSNYAISLSIICILAGGIKQRLLFPPHTACSALQFS